MNENTEIRKMTTQHKTYIFLGTSFLMCLIVFIITIVALNQKLGNSNYGNSLSIKQIWESVTKLTPKIIKATSAMAYFGSIITLCLTVVVFLYTIFC